MSLIAQYGEEYMKEIEEDLQMAKEEEEAYLEEYERVEDTTIDE
jgi:hypothetical protein